MFAATKIEGHNEDLRSAVCSSSMAYRSGIVGSTPGPMSCRMGKGPNPHPALGSSYGTRGTAIPAPCFPCTSGMSTVGTHGLFDPWLLLEAVAASSRRLIGITYKQITSASIQIPVLFQYKLLTFRKTDISVSERGSRTNLMQNSPSCFLTSGMG